MSQDDAIESYIYATGERIKIPITRRIASVRSRFQEIAVVETARFGKCLLLDGIMQTAETDHHLYDDALLGRLRGSERRILVVGGGDGYVALRAAGRAQEARIVMVDIDADVVALCVEHLNPALRSHPRIDVRIEDGIAYARALQREEGRGRWDGVVLDLTDVPVDPARAASVEALYEEMIAAVTPLVAPGGWIGVQAGAPIVAGHGPHLPTLLRRLLADRFLDIEQRDVHLDSYAEQNSFLLGTRAGE